MTPGPPLTPLQCGGILGAFKINTIQLPAAPVARENFMNLVMHAKDVRHWRGICVTLARMTPAAAGAITTRVDAFIIAVRYLPAGFL